MQPDKDNFAIARNDKDVLFMPVVKMINKVFDGTNDYYGITNGQPDCWGGGKYSYTPLITCYEAAKLLGLTDNFYFEHDANNKDSVNAVKKLNNEYGWECSGFFGKTNGHYSYWVKLMAIPTHLTKVTPEQAIALLQPSGIKPNNQPMTPSKDNFYFRHTKGDAVSERAVKMVNPDLDGIVQYYAKINGVYDCDMMEQFFIDRNIREVTPAEAIRLMEGGEVWEPKWGESVLSNSSKAEEYIYGCKNLHGHHVLFDHDGQVVIAGRVYPIQPAPPTAEQELKQIIKNYNVSEYGCMLLEILQWHTKHQPKEVEVTDEEILDYFNKPRSGVIDLVRWALARAKGKE